MARGAAGAHAVLAKGHRPYAGDSWFVRPHLRSLKRALRRLPRDDEAIAILVEAVPKFPAMQGAAMEAPVASAVVRTPCEADGAAFLTMLRVVNEARSLEVLLEAAAEALAGRAQRVLLGPSELSPYLGYGALASHWSAVPAFTPYNPPYLPELARSVMSTQTDLMSLAIEVDALAASWAPRGRSSVLELAGPTLPPELLPLLRAACEVHVDLPALPESEVAVIAALLEPHRPLLLVAPSEGRLVGIALVLSGGSARRGWHLARAFARTFGASAGDRYKYGTTARLVFWGVLEPFRGRGIGRDLLSAAGRALQERGQEYLSIGPVAADSRAARIAQRLGAKPAQRFELLSYGF